MHLLGTCVCVRQMCDDHNCSVSHIETLISCVQVFLRLHKTENKSIGGTINCPEDVKLRYTSVSNADSSHHNHNYCITPKADTSFTW